MKKSLIALAAMSVVAGAAQAQSSVTIYGIIDSGYLSTESDASKLTASSNTVTAENRESKGITSSASSSSRLGFRGTEDLGGGLRAEFVVETGLNATNSTVSTFNNRQSFMGLTGGFGTFRIGTQYTAHHNLAAAFSPSTGVNMAGDLNYTTGPVTSGALSNLNVTTTATIAKSGSLATIDEVNYALQLAGLNNATRTSAGSGGVAATTGTVVAQDTSGTVSEDALSLANATSRAQAILNADATAKLAARLARADMNGYTVRRNNTISYASPTVNGFQLGLGYNAPQTDVITGGNQVKASSQTISLSFTQGKFAAAVAHAAGKSESTTVTSTVAAGSVATLTTFTGDKSGTASTRVVTLGTTPADDGTNATNVSSLLSTEVAGTTTRVEVKGQETMAGASYDLGVAKLGYIYSAKKAKDLTSDLIDRKSHSFNISAPLTAKVTAWANYADGKQDVVVVNKYDLKAMQLGARYNFSKRTDLYAIYGQTKIDNKAAGAVDLKDTQYAVGLRHSF